MAVGLLPALAITVPPPPYFRCENARLQRQHFSALRSTILLNVRQSRRRSASVPRRSAAADDRDFLEESPPVVPQKQEQRWRIGWKWLGVVTGLTGFLFVGYIAVKRVTSVDVSSSTQLARSGSGFSFTANIFGRQIFLGERTPGWIYFLLLMAAGFGLFVSEEALVVWVGAAIARSLTWNSTREVFWSSVSQNGTFILSTILWVYWGVCISDMVPFYAGKLTAQSGSGETFRSKLGISREKLEEIAKAVQRYGNVIGFVERFSVGARNPTSFLAGASGIEASKFFAGVCLGGLLTLPLQMSVGFMLRDRPVIALAGVAAFVGIWTVFPYLTATFLSIFYLQTSQQQQTSNTRTEETKGDQETK
ncbi:uncharacterized protein LOC9631152 isoform X1 [Selaginella moellendorffii]|nr:uncharacterized protein LOC9641203 isoform X1 [Selaginella moellendorffii]XP_024528973.1 uncharacterized protein LOC9631152 isoform X1 [Selaginella moellendorffii]|eukprot:XP_024523861.1 uncharacterized protein LOC9641203 isoform X1 [Selaginella moellendorffii]